MSIRFIAVVCGLALGMMSVAGAEPAMQEAIASDELLSGQADERLENIGRRAAEQDLVLQVNAPDIWESEILTPVRRGAGDTRLEVKFVNTLSDTVEIRGVKAGEAEDPLDTLKRITNNAKVRSLQEEEPPEEEAGVASPGQPETGGPGGSSRPDIDRPATNVPEIRVERPKARLPQADARESSRRARLERGEERPAARPRPEPAETPESSDKAMARAEKPAPAAETDDAGASDERRRFERLYNDGRTIRQTLSADELKKEDLIFAGTHHNVVVRRGISTSVFWLDGEPPEDRIEHQERNRYAVVAAAEDSTPEPAPNDAPPGAREERERFERLYNQGRNIDATIEIAALSPGDELYVGNTVTVVLRRSRVSVEAFWLSEPVNLDQDGIEHEEKNKYVVVGDLR